jgi:hypothetical protein
LVVVNKENGAIIAVYQAVGCEHDFKMYKDEIGASILDRIKLQGDSGFQGVLEFHKNSETPKKKPKNGKLTKAEKTDNRRISRERILIENINAKIKVFKIMSNKYRNRRKRHALRMNLICAIINFELFYK